MNIKLITAFAGTLATGVAIGAGATRAYWEGKIREEYRVSSEAMRRAYELARIPVDEPKETEIELDYLGDLGLTPEAVKERVSELIAQPDGSVVEVPEEGTIIVTPMENEPVQNDYHKAISATETPVEMFVDGGVNQYGISYIEDEEYLEDDGRFKGRIDIMMNEHDPIFLMDGVPIDDWDRRVGDSILVDFYRLVPPGADDVLYVRNHRTEEDYEVVRVHP